MPSDARQPDAEQPDATPPRSQPITPIISGTTRERVIRTLALSVMVSVFSAWFLYDGYVGWPRQNLEKAVQALQPPPESPPAIIPEITESMAEALADLYREKTGTAHRLIDQDIEAMLGQPGWKSGPNDPPEWRYFGPGGVLVVRFNHIFVTDVSFVQASRREIELTTQLILGYGLLPIALIFWAKLIRVLTTRFTLDDSGLRIGGKPIIPLDDIQSIDAADFDSKGTIVLHYLKRGRPAKLRLDTYVVRDLQPIISAICDRKGMANPIASAEQT